MMDDYKCMCCGMELDETEFSDPRDADICGYCYMDRMNDIRRRELPFASGQNECGINREISMMADIEIRLEKSRNDSEKKRWKSTSEC